MTNLNPIANLMPLRLEMTPQEHLLEMTLATCHSPATRRIYRIRLNHFMASGHSLTREGVALHIQQLRDSGKSTAVTLGALSAIRKLAYEAQMRKLLSRDEYAGIMDIKAGPHYKTRQGQWLTIAQVQQLLALPDRSTYWGQRNACLLSLFVGCGLRLAELTSLTWSHLQYREGRLCLVNLKGKGNKPRTVPVPIWATTDVMAWQIACQQDPPAPTTPAEKAQAAVRKLNKARITGGLTYRGVFNLITTSGDKIGVRITPHDLRRTLARLLRKSGAALEQIQYVLGHASINTTQIYLNGEIELAPGLAAADKLDLGRPDAS